MRQGAIAAAQKQSCFAWVLGATLPASRPPNLSPTHTSLCSLSLGAAAESVFSRASRGHVHDIRLLACAVNLTSVAVIGILGALFC